VWTEKFSSNGIYQQDFARPQTLSLHDLLAVQIGNPDF
jgi:hypothetical protein